LHRTIEEVTDNDGQLGSFIGWRDITLDALEHKELRDAVQLAIASLPQKYREVLTLRDIQQMSIKETARALGLSLQNVKIRLLRARIQMRDALWILTDSGQTRID
jgi:RNA polymerase sigma-70 factor (ECF subfamily)